jgi:hypothetical protein
MYAGGDCVSVSCKPVLSERKLKHNLFIMGKTGTDQYLNESGLRMKEVAEMLFE